MDESAPSRGVARFDGLLTVVFAPDPGLATVREDAVRALLAASPVHFEVQREPGSVTLLPATSPVAFPAANRASRRLLDALRDFLAALGPEDECRVDSTLRVQEFFDRRVIEAVFVFEAGAGLTLAARERVARPGELPAMPEPSVAERGEAFLKRWRWPLVAAAAVLAVLVVVGFQSGIFGIGASAAEGPKIDAGPLAKVVTFLKVRGTRSTLVFFVRPGPEFPRFAEVAQTCDLAPGVFRVILSRKGSLSGAVLALDLRDLPARAADLGPDEGHACEVPWNGVAFDEVLICR